METLSSSGSPSHWHSCPLPEHLTRLLRDPAPPSLWPSLRLSTVCHGLTHLPRGGQSPLRRSLTSQQAALPFQCQGFLHLSKVKCFPGRTSVINLSPLSLTSAILASSCHFPLPLCHQLSHLPRLPSAGTAELFPHFSLSWGLHPRGLCVTAAQVESSCLSSPLWPPSLPNKHVVTHTFISHAVRPLHLSQLVHFQTRDRGSCLTPHLHLFYTIRI